MRPEPKRCAVYTRKSSEEGLEQSFNSLDAQREACAAYIASQRHEGWRALEARYDDGGYSGGSMERPALQALLSDIQGHKVDVVVVYKVDRLTRSLADFAKIVELFDGHGVSFVSVTQQFNTTTSMGRLTLNVLLSFAQFEREVTGERIRDKIAASKRKGMWMGGPVPLGYNLEDRKLVINAKEAVLVRRVFERYLALGCVRRLEGELKAKGIVSKRRLSRTGRESGGCPYSRGALYSILQNSLYCGQIAHRGELHKGQHEAIVDEGLWREVQAALRAGGQARRLGLNAKTPSLLAGLLYDGQGNRFTPKHATKGGKRYRYYTSQAVIRNGSRIGAPLVRIPAHELEELVCGRVAGLIESPTELLQVLRGDNSKTINRAALTTGAREMARALRQAPRRSVREFLLAVVSKIVVHGDRLAISLFSTALRDALRNVEPQASAATAPGARRHEAEFTLTAPFSARRARGEVRLVVPAGHSNQPEPKLDLPLIKALARSHRWHAMREAERLSLRDLSKRAGVNQRYLRRIMQLGFLSPDLVEQILEGRQAETLTLQRLMCGIPISWREQRALLSTAIV